MNSNFEPQQKPGLSTGRFAQAAQLTRKALRYYEKIGILQPDHVDPQSGYRYYRSDQLEKARVIRLLRSMEMPLEDISQVLEARTDQEALNAVQSCSARFENQVEEIRQATRKVIFALKKEYAPMATVVSQQHFPACQAYSLYRSITVPDFHTFIPRALEQIQELSRIQRTELVGDPLCFFYGPVNEVDDGPVEICWPAAEPAAPKEDIQLREIPEHQAAVGRASKASSKYPEILEIWDNVLFWVQNQSLSIQENSPPCYEIWHKDGTISVVQPFISTSQTGLKD